MNKVKRYLRDALEKVLARFYEGPEPPERIGETVILFRVLNPGADAEAWARFAIMHAEDCYRAGFVRGVERTERNPEAMPAELADAMERARHDWSLAASSPEMARVLAEVRNPYDPLDGVPEERRAEFFDELGAWYGTHRVVIVPEYKG